jgi:hypothetical protein
MAAPLPDDEHSKKFAADIGVILDRYHAAIMRMVDDLAQLHRRQMQQLLDPDFLERLIDEARRRARDGGVRRTLM